MAAVCFVGFRASGPSLQAGLNCDLIMEGGTVDNSAKLNQAPQPE